METLRLLIADDHPVFRYGIRALLNAAPGLEVVGEATTGDEAIAKAEALQPDVILMDIQMPGVNGVEATRRILHTSPHMRILIVTMFEDSASVFTAMRAGARGYIRKDIDPDKLVSAVRAVAGGEVVLATFASKVIFEDGMRSAPRLSDYDIELLRLIGSGKSYAEVAATLAVSESTLKRQLVDIQKTLGVDNKIQAVAYLARKGLL